MIPTNNLFAAFLKEMLQRFFTKSPKFFKIFQLLSGACTAVTGLPEFLQMFKINLPPALTVLENKAVAYAAMGVFFTALMTSQSKPAATKDDGGILKQTDETKLPFTAATEVKMADKMKDNKAIVVEEKKQEEPKA